MPPFYDQRNQAVVRIKHMLPSEIASDIDDIVAEGLDSAFRRWIRVSTALEHTGDENDVDTTDVAAARVFGGISAGLLVDEVGEDEEHPPSRGARSVPVLQRKLL